MIARVAGSGRATYGVALDWSYAYDGALFVFCTCPRFQAAPCKHLWATLLTFEAAGYGSLVPGSGELEIVADEDLLYELIFADEEDGDDSFGDEDATEAGSPAAWMPTPGDPQGAGWRQRLARLGSALQHQVQTDEPAAGSLRRQREAWYLIEIRPTFETGRLVVGFFQRQERRGGGWGKVKDLKLSEDELDSFTVPEDRELLSTLLALRLDTNGPRGPWRPPRHRERRRQATVPAPLHDFLLPRLCATGRCGWIEEHGADTTTVPRLTWDPGPPYRFALRGEISETEGLVRLHGELRRPDEILALDEPVLLLANGLAILRDRLARLDAGEAFPWIASLRQQGGLEVPVDQVDALLAELGRLPALPELVLPPELELEVVMVAPTPRLAFRSPPDTGRQTTLEAHVSCDYAGHQVEAGQGPATLIDPATRRMLTRDRETEAAALARLRELGLRTRELAGETWPLELQSSRFPAVVETLLAEGWVVEADHRRLRRPGALRLAVTSSVDWFDLAGEVDFEGRAVALPRLLEAVRRGERWIALGDGEQGMLPEDWLERYAPLAALVQEEDGDLRVLPSQALLLDMLLADTHVDADRRFAQVRQRLAGFHGVEPEPAPRGFHGALRPYQREGLGWLRFLDELGLGGCLADDMGLGKTVQVLAYLQRLRLGRRRDGQRRPHLVVAPRSLVYNWCDEAARFTPRLEVLDYTGRDRTAEREHLDRYDVIVTTYGTLRRDIVELRDREFDVAILDEAQAIKNAASQSAKACRLIRARQRLALTGTPVENHLGELFSIFEFLNPGMLGRLPKLHGLTNARTFAEENLAALSRALKPVILRRTKDEVLIDLPRKTEQILRVELSRGERRLYDELKEHYRASLAQRIEQVGLARSKIQVLEALLRLRQASCHPGLLNRERAAGSSAKLETLLEQLAEVVSEGHKALVFSQFVQLLAIVRRRLDAAEIPYEYLDGRTRKRKERVERFQTDPACPLFLISLKAGGLGLNLTAADYVFLADPWWNPAVETQAIDRAHRIGQTRPVMAYRLIARDTVEEKIQALQESKRHLAEAILCADKSAIRALTPEDLQFLLS
ncbi:MAG: SNF2-related protein [Thermoanaerobaculia bacterium]